MPESSLPVSEAAGADTAGARYLATARRLEQEGKLSDAAAIYADYLSRYPTGQGADEARRAVDITIPERQRGQRLLELLNEFNALVSDQRHLEAKEKGTALLQLAQESTSPEAQIEGATVSPRDLAARVDVELAGFEELLAQVTDLLAQARQAQAVGNLAATKEALQKARQLSPKDTSIAKKLKAASGAAALWERAREAAREESWDDVLNACEKILQRVPGYQPALDLQADTNRMLQEHARTRRSRARNAVLVPLLVVAGLLLCFWGFRRVQLLRQIKAFEQAVVQQQADVEAVAIARRLATVYAPASRYLDLASVKDRFEAAYLKAVKHLVELDQDQLAPLTALLEEAARPSLDFDARVDHYRQAITLLPALVESAAEGRRSRLLATGKKQLDAGVLEEAATAYRAVFELPGYADDAVARAGLAAVAKAQAEAAAAEKRRQETEQWLVKAEAALEEKAWADVLACAEKALELSPDSAKAGNWRSRAAKELTLVYVAQAEEAAGEGDTRLALENGSKAVALARKSGVSEEYRDTIVEWMHDQLISAAQAATSKDDWEKARKYAEEAAWLAPESKEAEALLAKSNAPRVRIVTVVDTFELPGMAVAVEGVPPLRKSPATVTLAVGKSYRIRVTPTAAHAAFFEPYETTYHVEEKGHSVLRVPLAAKSFCVPVPGEQADILDGETFEGDVREAFERQHKAAAKWKLPLEVRARRSGIHFRLIPPGRFTMGSSLKLDSQTKDNETPAHRVSLSRPFYLGKVEVTQGQWQSVTGSNPSHYTDAGESAPAEMLSWNACQEFCRSLCEQEGVPAGTFRLPTEAEWEYGCRAGSEAPYCFGAEQALLAKYAWFADQLAERTSTQPVGEKQPNAWGLFDMHGGVYEWCQDWYGPYSARSATDPTGPTRGKTRILRGGVFCTSAENCRSASRAWAKPDEAWKWRGVRILLRAELVARLTDGS